MGIETSALIAYAAIAGTAVSAAGAIYTADASRKSANAAADQAEADAQAARGQAMVQARKIRDATKARQSEAVAALAASGVDVSSGTAEQIQEDIGRRGEEDALTMIINGGRRGAQLDQLAAFDRFGGDQAMTAGYLNASSSVLSSVAAAAERRNGWRGTRTTGPWDLSQTSRGSGD